MMHGDFCNHDKTVKVTWGPDSHQTAIVCDNCMRLIWDACHVQVTVGMLPFIIEPLTVKESK